MEEKKKVKKRRKKLDLFSEIDKKIYLSLVLTAEDYKTELRDIDTYTGEYVLSPFLLAKFEEKEKEQLTNFLKERFETERVKYEPIKKNLAKVEKVLQKLIFSKYSKKALNLYQQEFDATKDLDYDENEEYDYEENVSVDFLDFILNNDLTEEEIIKAYKDDQVIQRKIRELNQLNC